MKAQAKIKLSHGPSHLHKAFVLGSLKTEQGLFQPLFSIVPMQSAFAGEAGSVRSKQHDCLDNALRTAAK